MTNQQRENFKAWAKNQGLPTVESTVTRFANSEVELAWKAYQEGGYECDFGRPSLRDFGPFDEPVRRDPRDIMGHPYGTPGIGKTEIMESLGAIDFRKMRLSSDEPVRRYKLSPWYLMALHSPWEPGVYEVSTFERNDYRPCGWRYFDGKDWHYTAAWPETAALTSKITGVRHIDDHYWRGLAQPSTSKA